SVVNDQHTHHHNLLSLHDALPILHYPPIDYQKISYYSAPKQKTGGPKSLEEVDPELLKTYEKLGIPLHERAKLAGVAVDAVFDRDRKSTRLNSSHQINSYAVFCLK